MDECGVFLNGVREPDAQRPTGCTCTDPPAPCLNLFVLFATRRLMQIQHQQFSCPLKSGVLLEDDLF